MLDDLSSIANQVMVEEGCVLKEIGGNKYVITMLPAMQGVSLAKRLLKAFVPLAGMWVDGSNREGLILPEDDNLYTELAMLFVNNLDDVNVEEVIAALFSGLTCNGSVVDFDTHFRKNYSNLLLILEEALKENFGSFFGDYLKAKGINLQEGLQALKTRMPQSKTAE